jgi:hypothetical protein
MRRLLLAAILLVLVFGVFFAGNRLKKVFQIGAVLYAISLVGRFFIYGVGDPDNLLDVITIAAILFVIWLIAKGIVEAILSRRERARRPPA